jgi:hypothetical protein
LFCDLALGFSQCSFSNFDRKSRYTHKNRNRAKCLLRIIIVNEGVACVSVCLSVCLLALVRLLYVCMTIVCMFVCSLYVCMYGCVYYVCLFVCLYVACLSVCLFGCLYVCLSVCLLVGFSIRRKNWAILSQQTTMNQIAANNF